MKLRFNLLIVFSFLFFVVGFSQDPAQTKKVIYKISADKVKPSGSSTEPKRIPAGNKSVHSCEIDKIKKEAIVTTKSPDGTLVKEKFEIKENK